MREYFLSNSEKSFIQKLISEGNRLDGRQYNESRKLRLAFGSDWGSCLVSLGETKVLSQVSCDVVQPKQIRPNEGLLHINVELSPMAAPYFEVNRQTDLTVYLTRLLEKCFKDSRSVDLESLCIVVEEKVWNLRVDIRILNHDGNMMECASIAALASLAHFKRPDVTRSGDTVTIHTVAERDPIPTVLYHYPVCVSFGIFPNDVLISDPSFMEELVCMSDTEQGAVGGVLAVGMNQYRELCLLNLTGAAMAQSNLFHRATVSAANRCKYLVDTIKMAIIEDDNLRQKRIKVNFGDAINSDGLVSLSKRDLSICLKRYKSEYSHDQHMSDADVMDEEDVKPDLTNYKIVATNDNTAKMETKPKESQWIEVSSESEEN